MIILWQIYGTAHIPCGKQQQQKLLLFAMYACLAMEIYPTKSEQILHSQAYIPEHSHLYSMILGQESSYKHRCNGSH